MGKSASPADIIGLIIIFRMGLFDFLKGKKGEKNTSVTGELQEEAFTCAKCGKVKKEIEGNYVLEGSAFCCKECCGDPAKGEHKQKTDTVCEFC